MKRIILTATLACFSAFVFSQVDGEFRTRNSGDWHAVTTWERFNSTLQQWLPSLLPPTPPASHVVIRPTHSVMVNLAAEADEVIIEEGGSLVIEDSFLLPDGPGEDITCRGVLRLGLGSITGNGDLEVTGRLEWLGGTLDADVMLKGGGNALIDSAQDKILAAHFVIAENATCIWNNGRILFAAGIINNSGIFDLSFDGTFSNLSGTSYFINKGVFRKMGGIGFFVDSLSATSNESNAQFNILSGGYRHEQGNFENYGKIHIAEGSRFVNLDSMYWRADSFPLTGTGTLEFGDGSTTVFNLSLPFLLPAGLAVSFSGGRVECINKQPIWFRDSLHWSGGTLAANVVIDSNAKLLVDASTEKFLEASIVVAIGGEWQWSGGNIFCRNAGIINHGNFSMSFDGNFMDGGGSNSFVNEGIFQKTAGSGSGATSILSIENRGEINIQSGSLQLLSGGFINRGKLNLQTGAVLNASDSSVFGTGCEFSGSGKLKLSQGVHYLETDLNIPQGFQLDLFGGRLAGAATLTIFERLVWSGGTIACGVRIPAGDTLFISSPASKTIEADLQVLPGAVVQWSGGNITCNNSGILNEGNFNSAFDGTLLKGNGTGFFENRPNGIFQKTGGSSTTNIQLPFDNQGLLSVNTGYCNNSSAGFLNKGRLHINPGTFFYNSGNLENRETSSITGRGTLNLFAGVHAFADGQFQLPATISLVITGGSMQGTGYLSLAGSCSWTGGRLEAPLMLNTGASMQVTGPGDKWLRSILVLEPGSFLTWTGGDILFEGGYLSNEGTIINSGTAAMRTMGGMNEYQNLTPGIFINSNTTSSFHCEVPVVNEGSFTGTGTMEFLGNFANRGRLLPGNPSGKLSIQAINGALSASSVLELEMNNAGGSEPGNDLLLHKGSLTLAGTLKINETGIVPNGVYPIIQLSPGSFSGQFALLQLPAGYSVQQNDSTLYATKSLASVLYFRSIATGSWQAANSWEQSTDGINWSAATRIPDGIAHSVLIRPGHTINSNADVTVKAIFLAPAAALVISAGNFEIKD